MRRHHKLWHGMPQQRQRQQAQPSTNKPQFPLTPPSCNITNHNYMRVVTLDSTSRRALPTIATNARTYARAHTHARRHTRDGPSLLLPTVPPPAIPASLWYGRSTPIVLQNEPRAIRIRLFTAAKRHCPRVSRDPSPRLRLAGRCGLPSREGCV